MFLLSCLHSGFQSWNLLRLKKEIVDEFPALKEKRSAFSYRLMFFRTCDELLKAVKKLRKIRIPTGYFPKNGE